MHLALAHLHIPLACQTYDEVDRNNEMRGVKNLRIESQRGNFELRGQN